MSFSQKVNIFYFLFFSFSFPKIMLSFSRKLALCVTVYHNITSFMFNCSLVAPSIFLGKYKNAHFICPLFRDFSEDKVAVGKLFHEEPLKVSDKFIFL